MKQQETIAVKAERIIKEARHKLEVHPDPTHRAFDCEQFKYKDVLMGIYYFVCGNGKERLAVAICKVENYIGPSLYHYDCNLRDGEIVNKKFFQQKMCREVDFSCYNDLIFEVFEEAIPYVLDRSGYPKKNS